MSDQLRVVLAEDNLLVREGTKMLLQSAGEIDVVGAASNAEEARQLVESLSPDAVITDIRMPPSFRLEGIDLALEVRTKYPKTGVVVLSSHDDPEYALALFKDGSAGLAYLLKERVAEPEQLLHAVREVTAGGAVMNPKVVDALVSREASASGLSEYEQKLLELMSKGMSYERMAVELDIPAGAVDLDVSRVLAKLATAASQGVNVALEQLRRLHASVMEKEQTTEALSQYLSPQVTEAVRAGGSTEAREVEVSVVFTDIRGFTALSEKYDLGLIRTLLNEHLSAMSDLVLSNAGTVDKFLGDSVMAIFGAPRDLPDHAQRAVECAQAMIRRQDELNAAWIAAGHPEFGVGIGVNTGPAMAGSVGGTKREYTVTGDAGNVAQRLNSLAAPREIVASVATASAAGLDVSETESVTVKGRARPVELIRVRPAMSEGDQS
ncbi:MAG: adenylate/guanylate cyclase domain-containing protein [Actinomycetota bacterium]